MELIKQFWGDEKEISDEDKFLRYYLLSQAWKEGKNKKKPQKKEIDIEKIDEEDYERDSEMDKYEAEYNMRFEDGTGAFIPTHSRIVEDSLRNKANTRKEKRKEREQKKKEEKEKKLKELNKAKSEEIKSAANKLAELEKSLGKSIKVSEKELDEDFDPKKHEELEKKMFGEDFYKESDPNLNEVLENKEILDIIEEKEENENQDENQEEKIPENSEDSKNVENVENVENQAEDDEENYDENQGEEEEWWFCDNCKKPIKGGDIRYDCTMCDNFTLCRKCFKTLKHPHKMNKEKTPMIAKPPQDHLDLIRRVILACAECGTDLAHIKGYECPTCQKNFCQNCKKKHPHEVKRLREKGNEDVKEMQSNSKFDAEAQKHIEQEYNDLIAGEIPAKFSYMNVPNEDFGLTDEELILLKDKEINSMIPMKKVAAYTKSNDFKKSILYKKKKRLSAEISIRKREIEAEMKTGQESQRLAGKRPMGKEKRVEIEKPTELEGTTIKKSRLETYDL